MLGIRVIRGPLPAVQIEPWKIKGNPAAKVFIVEFSDFECPYCSKIRPALKEVLDAFPNDLKIIFKHFPLNIHANAQPAAEAAECAADQGQFWPYHDYLFDHVGEWHNVKNTNQKFTEYAGHLGLEKISFQECVETHAKKSIVDANTAEARHFFVSGTPTCLLNGRKVLTSHKPEDIKKLVQAAIDEANRP